MNNMKKIFVMALFLVFFFGCIQNDEDQINNSTIINPPLEDEGEATINEFSNTTRSGTITSDEVWSGEILIDSFIVIEKEATLTIKPGTKVKFKHYRGYTEPWKRIEFLVLGTLKAVGTPEEQIWFTSDAEEPINGDWSMIRFEDVSNESIIKYAIIEFGQQGINFWNSNVTISHSIVRWNNWEGIYLESYSEPLIEYNMIYQNGYNGIAMEQFNNAIVKYNYIADSGTNGIHIDASEALVEYNWVVNNTANQLSVDDHGTLVANHNTLSEENAIGCGDGENVVVANENNFMGEKPWSSCGELELIDGVGVEEIDFDYNDIKEYDLDYTPGDPEKDKYMYIYPDDETRKIVKKIGEGFGLTWSVAFDGEYLWTSTLWGDVYQLDPENGEIKKEWLFPGPQAWGMTFDGEHLWINDFAEKKVYEMDTDGNVISSFLTPDQEGGSKGITWDGEYLYIMGWTSPTIYKVNKNGELIEEIETKDGGGGITFDGKYFWIPGCSGICKLNKQGERVGEVYAASEGTWDLAWDYKHKWLWATQRTNENWFDEKLYALEILDDSLKK